ncbi:ATP-dependent RNA helicase DbpA [Algibacillus agarilyticus]|uniref:ATP-dependent RNA helicase DbpA n=1 Tax=Algibacillus agarilyticus TaxID=2234133 RepID=UPI000DD09288|nr:ATP-dependent RNA helicase DbpA [Algibacillus agarilyticus]
MSNAAFNSLNLKPELLTTLESLKYTAMTPIQEKSLPPILAGKDVIAQGQTGSGKTAAFALGLLQKLNVKRFRIQTLVLCPTRELADQVATEIRTIARGIHNIKVLTLCGGMPFGPQVGSLEHGAHIIVGTPGRIDDHLNRKTLSLADVDTLVLDEADRMLDMGFQETLDAIIDRTPKHRQTLLFSATYPDTIQAIAKRVMKSPEMIKVASQHSESTIQEIFYKVDGESHRLTAVRLLLQAHKPQSTIVFCNMKKDTQAVADSLCDHGFAALALNGDLEQRDRDKMLVQFANKSATVLVATDVAARGLDISDLDAVINFNLAHDPEVHTHRIGRTGRAGSKGIACTLYNEKESYRAAQLDSLVDPIDDCQPLPSSSLLQDTPPQPLNTTLLIDGGKKQKLRPGDILGALTAKNGIDGKQVGKINVAATWSYVAVNTKVAKRALKILSEGKMKGRNFRVRTVS